MFNFIFSLLNLIKPNSLKSLFTSLGIILSICFISIFIFIIHKVNKLEKENYLLSKQIHNCQVINKKLSETLILQEEKYKKKINELLKLANKPPKIIKIPKVITKKIYITNKECKQMAIMIDKFIQMHKGQKCSE